MFEVGSETRILGVASAGGHLTQLLLATSGFDETFQVLYLTTRKDFVPSSVSHVSTISDISLDTAWKAPLVALQVLSVIKRFRPTVIITTGAAPGLIALCVGRLVFARTIWIDSCANVERVSRSGLIASFIAHVSLTQWPSLAKGRFKYVGSVL